MFAGARGGLTEPGEDHVSVLSVHGNVHGPGAVRGKMTDQHAASSRLSSRLA